MRDPEAERRQSGERLRAAATESALFHFEESTGERQARLGQLLAPVAAAALGFGAIEAVAARAYRDPVAGWSAAVMLGYGVAAVAAGRLNRRGRTELACAVASTGLLIGTALLAPLQPELHGPLSLVPLLAAVIAYPYLSGRPLALLLAAVVLGTASVHWLGEALAPATRLPAGFHLAFRPAAGATVVGLIAWFLWLHRSRLEARFRDERGRRGRLERAVDELAERERAARRLSWHDPLTGLANRSLGLERLKEALSRPEDAGGRSALVFVDLDDFKAVNDRSGHAFGDRVLVEVAVALRATVRSTDTLARFGGDELFLVMPRVASAGDVEMVARRLVDELRAVRVGDQRISGSLGLALAPDHGATPEELLRAADAAMYRAKAEGGSRWVWAGPVELPEPSLEDSGERETPAPVG